MKKRKRKEKRMKMIMTRKDISAAIVAMKMYLYFFS